MYPSFGISKSVQNHTLFEISPLSNGVFEVAVSGCNKLNNLHPFRGGGGAPGVCSQSQTSFVHPHNMETVSGSKHFGEIP